ncbi:hypothetical protein O181_060814 [Austropuccinia psidii MF-1]|uniref:Uncharacterized protein n=1 Tax=Austropuccinia psidii MF-1 TaxID=1389203 RepID=A0A9Q3EGY7_9BASI|nr:hypothetical protein [Austropuccinia psidii MF-1]
MSGGGQSSPHFPRSAPTNFEVNSEPELIQSNILRSEPFPSGSNRNISAPVQKMVQRSQGRQVGNITKLLEGGYELLLTQQELSGSGEDHRALRRMKPIFLQRQGQKYEELVEEPKSFIYRLEEGVGNDPSFGERKPSGINHLQKCLKTSSKALRRNREVPITIKAREKANPIGTDLIQKGKYSQIGAFSCGKCFQYGQKSYGIHSQEAGKDEQNFST